MYSYAGTRSSLRKGTVQRIKPNPQSIEILFCKNKSLNLIICNLSILFNSKLVFCQRFIGLRFANIPFKKQISQRIQLFLGVNNTNHSFSTSILFYSPNSLIILLYSLNSLIKFLYTPNSLIILLFSLNSLIKFLYTPNILIILFYSPNSPILLLYSPNSSALVLYSPNS